MEYYRLLWNITDCYRMSQNIKEHHRMLQNSTECYRTLQIITEHYRMLTALKYRFSTDTVYCHQKT